MGRIKNKHNSIRDGLIRDRNPLDLETPMTTVGEDDILREPFLNGSEILEENISDSLEKADRKNDVDNKKGELEENSSSTGSCGCSEPEEFIIVEEIVFMDDNMDDDVPNKKQD